MATPKKPTTKKRTPMSDEHKAALAKGREHGNAVRNYLNALDASAPKRGRKRSKETVQKRLADIESGLTFAVEPLKRLQLAQETMDLRAELERMGQEQDPAIFAAIEAKFVEHAKAYADSKGITRAAFREVGVPAAVLRAAGL